eukprot:scaffold94442_cov43-Attheya_sp.AAC.1
MFPSLTTNFAIYPTSTATTTNSPGSTLSTRTCMRPSSVTKSIASPTYSARVLDAIDHLPT